MSTFSSANVTDSNLLLKERTHRINNKIQLHILGVPANKLGNWLIVITVKFVVHLSLEKTQGHCSVSASKQKLLSLLVG